MTRKVRPFIGIFCVYQFLFNAAVLHSSFVISTLEPSEEPIDDCENLEFQCKNGQCINKSFLCDGLLDCTDGSDETYDQCQNATCDQHHFQCFYGACINKTYQCDGLKQCVDGSDEQGKICDNSIQATTRNRRAANQPCTIPAPSADRTVTFYCAENTSLICNPANELVSDLSIAQIKCTSGYQKEVQDGEEENNEYICRNKKWLPKIDQCFKICDKLNPVNVDLRCSRNGINIPCDEKSVLLHGTVIRPSCKPTHKYISDSPPNYSEITCNSDGKWDNPLFSCTPECGRTYTNPKLLIKGGTPEKYGDSPWHAAIYNQKKILICGGTIITPYLVISAAHCFHDEGKSPNTSGNIASNYEVVVGKFTRNYDTKDSNSQKAHKIRKIRFSDKGYHGASANFQADIAILVLEEKLNISSTVLPACIDWVALRDGIYPSEDTLGKVVGWGINEYGNYSDSLATVDLPFLGHQRCTEIVPEDFKRFITFDKFCAGTENGPGVLQGDSGGGLLFKKNNYYYLHGIVSLKEPSLTSIAAFTDVAEHVTWILKVRNEVDEELNKIAAQIRTTTLAPTTRDEGVKFPQAATNRPPVNRATQSPAKITMPAKKSATIALQYCKRYAEYRYKRIWQPAMANRPGYWQNTTDCVNVQPLIIGGTQTKPKEYPHMALIGFAKSGDFKNVRWLCGGTLISERFVLSGAQCSFQSPSWVLLGDLNITSTNDDARPAVYDIVRVHNHPNYNKSSSAYDITLFELNTNVAMSPYVRPACLHTSTSNLANTKGTVTGWGYEVLGGDRSEHLLKATITVLDDRQCSALYHTSEKFTYDPISMICAGDLINGKDTCNGDSGGPLQMPIKDQMCMWNVIGITSYGRGCADPEYPAVYTKVAHYIDWIQSIVWP